MRVTRYLIVDCFELRKAQSLIVNACRYSSNDIRRSVALKANKDAISGTSLQQSNYSFRSSLCRFGYYFRPIFNARFPAYSSF